ncbi:MAG: hypothetical protein ACLU3I_19615 [Acutalibacteraceae bacterium]
MNKFIYIISDMSVKSTEIAAFRAARKAVSPEILPEKIEKGILLEKSVIYLIRIASQEAFFWDYAPPRTAQQIDQLHIHMERRQRRSRPGRDGAQDTSLHAPVLLRLFCICSARDPFARTALRSLIHTYFFKKRVKSFGRKIKNHPAWRSE